MTPGFAGRWARYAGRAAIAAVLVAYPLFANYTITVPTEGGFAAIALAAAPLAAAALLVSWRSRWRTLVLVACVAAFALLWRHAAQIRQHVALVYFVDHAGTNLALMTLFGRTLTAGRMPLCTRLATIVRGPLEPLVAHYTRQVTLAWTVFFGALVAVSTLLFLFAPVAAWSIFANLMTMPLLALMFVAEYVVRLRVLPDLPHTPILAAVRAFRHTRTAATTPPR